MGLEIATLKEGGTIRFQDANGNCRFDQGEEFTIFDKDGKKVDLNKRRDLPPNPNNSDEPSGNINRLT